MMGYRKWLAIFVTVVMILALFPAVSVADENNDKCGEKIVDLIAGQNMEVGTVTVTNDDENICVTYALDEEAMEEGWEITETHLYIGKNIPPTSAPGQFPYDDDDDAVYENGTVTYCIPLDEIYAYMMALNRQGRSTGVMIVDESEEPGVEHCNDVYIAAHAVIEKVDCEILAEAPYGGSEVIDTFQAWRIDHTPEAPKDVREQRSNADNALEIGVPGQETFYSLGYGGVLNDDRTAVETFFGEYFEDRRDPDAIKEMEAWVDEDLAAKLSDTENNAGWIIIEFDPPAVNVDGEYDIQAVEDTWGLPYPLELAAIFGRADAGDDWTFLFLAHNQEPVGSPTYHTYTNGMLGDLDEAVQILVQDVSDPQWFIPYPHSVATLDGYDLNAIVALNDYEDCEEFDETAWGEGENFGTNWAMFFKYHICVPDPCVPASVIYGVAGDGSTGSLWEIDVSGDSIVETKLIDIASVGGATRFYPNGLAYDDVNHRLYYAVRSGSVTKLFMYDFKNDPVEAATGLTGEVYGATWGAGSYWYIPNGTDDMRIVTLFDSNGVNGTNELFEGNFAEGKSFNFGDIALDAEEGVIYVSTSFSGTNKEFFKYDLTKDPGDRYSLITTTEGAVGLQLGFAEDEVLYGHSTFGASQTGAAAQEWFAVDKAGTVTSLYIGENAYNDLASGPSFCE